MCMWRCTCLDACVTRAGDICLFLQYLWGLCVLFDFWFSIWYVKLSRIYLIPSCFASLFLLWNHQASPASPTTVPYWDFILLIYTQICYCWWGLLIQHIDLWILRLYGCILIYHQELLLIIYRPCYMFHHDMSWDYKYNKIHRDQVKAWKFWNKECYNYRYSSFFPRHTYTPFIMKSRVKPGILNTGSCPFHKLLPDWSSV